MKHARVAAIAALLGALWTVTEAQPLLPGERDTNITGIAGVVAPGAKWELVWADFETADGINGTPDGGVIFAQEQTDTIRKLDASAKEWTIVRPLDPPVSDVQPGLVTKVRPFNTEPPCPDRRLPPTADPESPRPD